jgi:hypothetical protein
MPHKKNNRKATSKDLHGAIFAEKVTEGVYMTQLSTGLPNARVRRFSKLINKSKSPLIRTKKPVVGGYLTVKVMNKIPSLRMESLGNKNIQLNQAIQGLIERSSKEDITVEEKMEIMNSMKYIQNQFDNAQVKVIPSMFKNVRMKISEVELQKTSNKWLVMLSA